MDVLFTVVRAGTCPAGFASASCERTFDTVGERRKLAKKVMKHALAGAD